MNVLIRKDTSTATVRITSTSLAKTFQLRLESGIRVVRVIFQSLLVIDNAYGRVGTSVPRSYVRNPMKKLALIAAAVSISALSVVGMSLSANATTSRAASCSSAQDVCR